MLLFFLWLLGWILFVFTFVISGRHYETAKFKWSVARRIQKTVYNGFFDSDPDSMDMAAATFFLSIFGPAWPLIFIYTGILVFMRNVITSDNFKLNSKIRKVFEKIFDFG